MRDRFFVLVLLAFAVAVFAPGRASAHDLKATVKTLADAIVLTAGFDDDTPAEGAKVVITDASGKEIASGKTDEKGVCKLSRPGPGQYKAVVESAGHRDEVPFTIKADPLAEPIEYARERPNQTVGLVLGVGGLLAASAGYWWFRRWKAGRGGGE